MKEYWWILQTKPYTTIIDANPHSFHRLDGFADIKNANLIIEKLRRQYPHNSFEIVGVKRLPLDERIR